MVEEEEQRDNRRQHCCSAQVVAGSIDKGCLHPEAQVL